MKSKLIYLLPIALLLLGGCSKHSEYICDSEIFDGIIIEAYYESSGYICGYLGNCHERDKCTLYKTNLKQ